MGDISVCAYCANILIVGDDMKLREPTLDEILEIQKDDHIWSMLERVIRTIKAFHASNKDIPDEIEIP